MTTPSHDEIYSALIAARRRSCRVCRDRPRACPDCLVYSDGVDAALAAVEAS